MKHCQNRLKYIVAIQIFNWGFVPIRASEPRIKLDANNSVIFQWDGSLPNSISEKEKYTTSDITALDDKTTFKSILDDAGKRWSSVPGVKLQVSFIESDSSSAHDDLVHSISVPANSSNSMGGVAMPKTGDDIDGSGEDKRVIVDCDIAINRGNYTARLLAKVITHEIGHCLGLGHAHTNKKAIMSYSRGGDNPELGADDQAGILYLYPGDDLITEEKEMIRACGVIADRGQSSSFNVGMLIVALGAVLPLVARRLAMSKPKHSP